MAAQSEHQGEVTLCPLCASREFSHLPRYSEGEWEIVKCSNCKFVYLHNPPGYEALVEDFAWEKTYAQEIDRRLETRKLGKRFSQATRWRLGLFGRTKTKLLSFFQTGNVLDVGCGDGSILLTTNGIPHGIEISKSLHKTAHEKMVAKGGYCVHAPAVEGVSHFSDAYFDAILLRSFLEHEQHPSTLLAKLNRVLKPEGSIYIRVPNYGSINRKLMGKKWCGFRYPDHIHYFTVASLKQMAANNGYQFKLLNPINIHLDDNIKAVLVRN